MAEIEKLPFFSTRIFGVLFHLFVQLFLLRAWPCTETSLCSFDGGPSLRLSAPASAPSAACTACSRRGSKTQRRQLHAGAKNFFCAIFRVALVNDALTQLALFAHQRDRMYLYGRKRRVRCYGASPRRQARLSQSVRGGGGPGKRKLRRSRGERDKRNKI